MTTEMQRIRTVSALLVTPDHKLVAQLRDDRPDLPYPNCWSTLGGRIENGEHPDEAMRRELIEEIEICPTMRFWRKFELGYTLNAQSIRATVYAYVGYFDCDLSKINLHEGQRLGVFGVEDLPGRPFAFGLDRLFIDFFGQSSSPEPSYATLAAMDDAPLVHRIMREAFVEYESWLLPRSGANDETIADVQQAMAQGGAVLIWKGSKAIGTGRFRLDPQELYVGRVAVLPPYRRKGVGATIMRYMEDLARFHNKTQIRVGVRMSLPHNLAFYRRLGYEIVSIDPHPRGFDQVVTMEKAILMERGA